METLDPATGLPLPANAIQRILFVAPKVHIYNIPPLASTRGYVAASWTDDPKRHIFTCRMRLIETATPAPTSSSGDEAEQIKVDVILEDPASGTLFAAAPYTTPAIVESALDSSRFFALRVQDPSGRKATLGMGFEDRSDAFDFSVALQEARKSLGIEPEGDKRERERSKRKEEEEVKRDYSLKEGETITVSFGGSKFGRRKGHGGAHEKEEVTGSLNSFALPPPPGTGAAKGSGIAIPPPPAGGSRQKAAPQDFGFDDGQFGEFA
ncbi:DUF1681-domain-containing protein [Coniochaeta hoffmannii]|uniref:DUF1681-domain-containing protein n=1 Tax=Coniochaeta hoffmannii TaxID=91930 RepID=A0AA38RNR8_9PEZI|nr:DUF1681-domain-containing protein [Coniochaeta hoffmannii]